MDYSFLNAVRLPDDAPRPRLIAPPVAQHHERNANAPVVARQSEYRGGWPLGYMGSECPAHSPSKCTVRYGFDNLNCCPSGQTCQDDILTIYCCPSEADCRAAVANRPVCANSTWDMYLLSKNKYFCCPKTYFGVLPASGSAGLCEPNVSGIPATRVASLVTAPTSGTGTPSGGNSGSGGSNGEGSGGGGGNSQGTAGGSGTGAGSGSSTEGGSSSGSGISAGAIAGIVIGGIILLAIVVSAILWYHRWSLRRAPPAAKTEPPSDWGVNGSGTGSGQHQTPMAQASSPASTPMPPPQYQYAPPPNQPEVGGAQIVEMPGSRS